MVDLVWHTTNKKVNELIPHSLNPRKLSAEKKRQLLKSLKTFGLVEIPVIDIDNKIIAGHQRLMLLQQLGRGDETIDVRMPNRKLTEYEFNEYLLRSNKTSGEWDFALLNSFDEDLLLAVGFESEELEGSEKEKLKEETMEIKPYKKAHVLISIDIDKINGIFEILETLCKIEGVEIEQSAN